MRRALLAVVCVAAAAGLLPAARAAGPTRTRQVIASFDGTPIASTLFLPAGAGAAAPVPVVLNGPHYGGTGETEIRGHVEVLLRAGYAVLTWDPRGFGGSGGTSGFDAIDVEARDVGALIGWLARHPAIRREAPGDPVVGMSGLSYGAAIQLATAAVDGRVDAIAPEAAWFDLRYSLFPNGVPKLGWNATIWEAAVAKSRLGGVPLEQHRLFLDATAGDAESPETARWLHARSLTGYGPRHPVRVPTLVLQATNDYLFNLNEGIQILRHVRGNGAPARLIAYCGGHGICLHPHDRGHLDRAVVAWFDRHLRGDAHAPVGAPVEYATNAGLWRQVADFPPPDARMVRATAKARLVTGVYAHDTAGEYVVPVLTAPAGGRDVVGVARAMLTATGVGTGGTIALRLVHREANEVLNNQELPVRLSTLSSTPQQLVVDLAAVAHTLPAGHHLDLHLVTDSSWVQPSRTGGLVDVHVTVDVPVRP